MAPQPLPAVCRFPHPAVPDAELSADVACDRCDRRAAAWSSVAGRDAEVDRFQSVEFVRECIDDGAAQSRHAARAAYDEKLARSRRIVNGANAADELACI